MGAVCTALFLLGQAQSASLVHAEVLEQFEGDAKAVLIARERIESGTVLSDRLFESQVWPEFYLPEGAIAAEDYSAIDGRRVSATILAGEVLTSARVFDQPLPLDRLAEGMTAVTLSTDNVHALGGELLRGMHLNLMASLTDGRVEELARNIEVLSANTSAIQAGVESNGDSAQSDAARSALIGGASSNGGSSGNESINWVTLAIPDDQVEQVLTAARAGTIHLVLPRDGMFSSNDSAQDE